MKHEGFSAHRLSIKNGNPREVAFARQWQQENDETTKRDPPLMCLVRDPTDRDAQVAATIIQWLGSNAGMCFLRDVIQKSPEVRQWFDVVIP